MHSLVLTQLSQEITLHMQNTCKSYNNKHIVENGEIFGTNLEERKTEVKTITSRRFITELLLKRRTQIGCDRHRHQKHLCSRLGACYSGGQGDRQVISIRKTIPTMETIGTVYRPAIWRTDDNQFSIKKHRL